jgi:pimeloyl-ACP methyl ester carboxylesterase
LRIETPVSKILRPLLCLLALCCGPGAWAGARLPLTECRLEHPLHLSSVTARCGQLAVPEDPEHPAAGSIALAVAVVPALNRRSDAAPLFILAGGPGQSAQSLYAALAGAFARINREHDIVLVDQRGTGRSHPQSCAYPEDWQEPADPLPVLRSATQACLQQLGERVRFYTSSVAVHDLELVRAALGYERIELYGASYGTRVAQLYMRREPERVSAAILDGVTYPEQIIGPDTPADAEHALALIVARCAAQSDCARAFPELAADLKTLRQQYGTQKTQLKLNDPNSGLPQPLEFNRSVLTAALRFLSYNSTQASLLPVLIHEAAHGVLAPLAAQTVMSTRQVGEQLAVGMQYSVVCSEDVPFFAGVPQDRAAQNASYFGREQLEALEAVCALWPRGPVDADLHAPLKSAVPTLLLSGEADPVTPPAAAERAAQGLSHHRHLVLSGEGHGQLASGCMPRLTAQFLNGTAPEALDAHCLDAHTVVPFFVTMTGPAP